MHKSVLAVLELGRLGAIPFGRETLLPLLAGYKRPNDKISHWLEQGVLIALKRGLYIVGPDWRGGQLSLPLVANRLYGPSCVSLDYALSWHGLTPERVYELTSICLGRSRSFDNNLGRFSYTRVPSALFSVGIQQQRSSDDVVFLIAGPEKALCDKILLTRHLQVVSPGAMWQFVVDDLRVDPDMLAEFDRGIVDQYVQSGHKPRQMKALRQLLESM